MPLKVYKYNTKNNAKNNNSKYLRKTYKKYINNKTKSHSSKVLNKNKNKNNKTNYTKQNKHNKHNKHNNRSLRSLRSNSSLRSLHKGGFNNCNIATVKEPGFNIPSFGGINGLSIPESQSAIYRPNCTPDTYQAMIQ